MTWWQEVKERRQVRQLHPLQILLRESNTTVRVSYIIFVILRKTKHAQHDCIYRLSTARTWQRKTRGILLTLPELGRQALRDGNVDRLRGSLALPDAPRQGRKHGRERQRRKCCSTSGKRSRSLGSATCA